MAYRNNLPIRYKGQTLWTNARLLRVFTLLLMDEMNRADPSNVLVLKPSYLDFDFETIFYDELELKKVKESIGRINDDISKDYFISSSLVQKITSILKSITPSIGNRELSKEVTQVTSIRPETMKELLAQIERLLNEEEPFKTDKNVSIDYLVGRWESKTIAEALDFDINFNMTDFNPSQNVNLQILHDGNRGYSISIATPAIDCSTGKIVELKLINGNVLLDNGVLRITETGDSKVYKMPVIRVDNGQFETYLFKTRIIFEKY